MIKVRHQFDRVQRTLVAGFYYFLRITLSLVLGFLSAKCSLSENFSPFSLILLSVSPEIGLIPTFCYLGAAFGVLLNPFNLSVFKYITALTMIYVIYMIFHKSLKIEKKDTAVLSAACCFTSGFLFLLVGQLNLFNVLILIGECILICCCIYFVTYAVRAFRRCCYLSSRELIAAAITLILILVSLHNVYFFNMSVARIVSIALLFLALCCLKTSHTAVLGSCLGIILAAVGNGGEAIFSAVVVGTLVCCVFSAFSDRFAMAAFILVYYAVLFFFGKFPWNYWYFGEPLLAFGMVALIPKAKLRSFLSSYIAVKKSRKQADKEKTPQKLLAACREDCDMICPKAAICYEKNEPELSEALEALSERFFQTDELGRIEDAIPFCIKPRAMAEIIEKRLVSSQSEDFEDLVDQLNHLSRKIELKMDASVRSIRFLTDDEEKIRKTLEKRGLTVRDISLFLDERGSKQCEIYFTGNGDLLYENIVREVVAPHFPIGFLLTLKENEGIFTARIRESAQFSITCCALCKTKKDEQISGDTAIGFSIGKSLYYLVLADGMGSGKEASLQSELVIGTIRKLIAGGLSIPGALKIYRSAARFRRNDVFTTVDICAVDLDSGAADFYKAGAFDSYHIHNGRLTVLSGGGVPLGLCEKDRLRHLSVQLSDGDYLILASDGLSALEGDLEKVLTESIQENVRDFARRILRSLSEKSESGKDDVTVMVCKFQKNAE